jgi:hypothetical protein
MDSDEIDTARDRSLTNYLPIFQDKRKRVKKANYGMDSDNLRACRSGEKRSDGKIKNFTAAGKDQVRGIHLTFSQSSHLRTTFVHPCKFMYDGCS